MSSPQENVQEKSGQQVVLSAEQLDKHWQDYKQQLKEADKNTEVAILNQKYSLIEDNLIELQINSLLQEDILERFRVELLTYLRKNCDNPDIKLKTRMVQEVKEKKLYTSQDKLNYLSEKNPHIQELQQRLGLDIDF